MTVNEAVERIKEMYFMCDDFYNCKYGHDCTNGCSEAVKMATKALEKLKVGKDNMVISSSDLMTILNSDSEELKQYKEVGTVEEFKVLKEKSVTKKPIQQETTEKTHYKCPCCNNIMQTIYRDGVAWGNITNYCNRCGQALET